jgi:hypothetical protein
VGGRKEEKRKKTIISERKASKLDSVPIVCPQKARPTETNQLLQKCVSSGSCTVSPLSLVTQSAHHPKLFPRSLFWLWVLLYK